MYFNNILNKNQFSRIANNEQQRNHIKYKFSYLFFKTVKINK